MPGGSRTLSAPGCGRRRPLGHRHDNGPARRAGALPAELLDRGGGPTGLAPAVSWVTARCLDCFDFGPRSAATRMTETCPRSGPPRQARDRGAWDRTMESRHAFAAMPRAGVAPAPPGFHPGARLSSCRGITARAAANRPGQTWLSTSALAAVLRTDRAGGARRAPSQGVEPRPTGSEPAVLPLDQLGVSMRRQGVAP